MSYAKKLEQFSIEASDTFEEAVKKAALEMDAKFEAIINDFINDLNSRYKRHCFIFSDVMGSKAVNMYHRVTGDLLCWWGGSADVFIESNGKVAVESPFRYFSDTGLSKEISDFIDIMERFESSVDVGYYFQWQGKERFDHVTDRMF